MKKHLPEKNSKYLLWPIFVLLLLTIGVFVTTNETQKEQDTRTGAQVFQDPSLFPSGFADELPTSTPAPKKSDITPSNMTLKISFSLPGISSQAGNLSPLHPTRDIFLNFFDRDINTSDKTSKPLYTIKTTADFDPDSESPTYASFINNEINLKKICDETSQCVPAGKYQIAIKTYQALQEVSRKRDTDIGGIAYDVRSGVSNLSVSFGNLIIGDIAPEPAGDNVVDDKDMSVFTNCVGDKFNSDSCPNKQGGDFDDNGSVDGYDYNLLVLSFERILARGGTIPAVNSKTDEELQKKPVVKTPTPTVSANSRKNSAGGVIFTLILLIVLIGGIVFDFKTKKIRNILLKKQNIGNKEYFIKKEHDDPDGKSVWLTLADDEGLKIGRYQGKEVKEGFARIKGTPKKEDGKKFIEISEIIWEKDA